MSPFLRAATTAIRCAPARARTTAVVVAPRSFYYIYHYGNRFVCNVHLAAVHKLQAAGSLLATNTHTSKYFYMKHYAIGDDERRLARFATRGRRNIYTH